MPEKKSLGTIVMENISFVLIALLVAVGLILIAYFVEKAVKKKNGDTERILSTRKIAMIGMFGALSAILMLFEFPLPFAPSFYKLDFSEIPVLIGAFAFGPVTGVMTELVKVLLKLLIKSTSTAFVGDFANFVVGCSFVLPASVLYLIRKNKQMALVSSMVGIIIMTIFGTAFNAVYLLPAFSKLYGMPLDVIIGMGTEINASITNVGTFVFYAVAPLNFIKGSCDTLVTLLVYKKLSPILKGNRISKKKA